jgi:CRISPR-associated endonuclease Csy4
MNYYLEITLLPNTDLNLFSLWSKVFQQIHLGLVEMQDEQGQIPIGVSFPEYKTGEKYSVLGGKLRLLAGDEATLGRFNATQWLSRLSDYVHCTGIRPVPEKIMGYAIYQREQPKTSNERLARRYAKRHSVDYDTALERYSAMTHKTIATPFIRLKSLSGDQAFCLWIKKTVVAEPSGSTFSSYGLSAVASVPEF